MSHSTGDQFPPRVGERLLPPDERAGARDVPPDERAGAREVLPDERAGARDVLPDERAGAREVLPDERAGARDVLPDERAGARDVLPDERAGARDVLPDERAGAREVLPDERAGARDVLPDERAGAREVLPDERAGAREVLPDERVVGRARMDGRVPLDELRVRGVDTRPVLRFPDPRTTPRVREVGVRVVVPTVGLAVLPREEVTVRPEPVLERSVGRTPARPEVDRVSPDPREAVTRPELVPVFPLALTPLRPMRPVSWSSTFEPGGPVRRTPPTNELPPPATPRPIVRPRGP